MPKELKVVVSRQWKNPTIAIEVELEVNGKGIAIGVPLVAFLAEVVAEVGNPTLIVTQEMLRKRLFAAAEVLVAKMKAESVTVV